jgi:drug/metabolite transporter (DMT)-like permease
VSFARLRAWDWVAFVAALALLFVTATDWYSTTQGDEDRRIEHLSQGAGFSGDFANHAEEARIAAEGQEKNAWQVTGAIDRILLLAVLATAALGVLGAFFAASGRSSRSAIPPAAMVAIAAVVTALLVLYRLIQEPGADVSTTVKLGPPLALFVLGVLGFASASSLRSPRAEPEPEPEAERKPGTAPA